MRHVMSPKRTHTSEAMLSGKARLYIALVAITGAALIVSALLQWESTNPLRYAAYVTFALAASTLKLKLPGIDGTFSTTSLVILLGVAKLSISETVLLGSAAILMQSLWKTNKPPQTVQVAFNVANVAISATIAHLAGNWNMPKSSDAGQMLAIPAAVAAFFLCNTGLVSMVIALTSEQRVRDVWQSWFLGSFPYYAVSAAIAELMVFSDLHASWPVSLLMLPLVYLAYTYFRLQLERMTGAAR
jgi:MASE9